LGRERYIVMNYRLILRVIGLLLIVEATAMMLSMLVALMTDGRDTLAFALAAGVTLSMGSFLFFRNFREGGSITRREGFLVVSLVWLIISLCGTLPYLISGEIPRFTDAFYESVSGFTTTGSTVISNIESQSAGMLFWRALTQWLGGMGIIMFTLSFMKSFGIGGMQLFSAEVPGVTHERVSSRIQLVARNIWLIYLSLTALAVLLLFLGGMPLFDSICHALSTMSSSGFSTKQAGLSFWPSLYIHGVIIFFMIIAGTNFNLIFLLVNGKFRKVFHDEEFRSYLFFILGFTILVFSGLLVTTSLPAGRVVQDALFMVVSVITTTGYVTSDYTSWAPAVTMLLFCLFFFGGMTGSTGGGMKIMRIIILLKNAWHELWRLLHPNAVMEVKFNGRTVDPRIITNVLAFFVFYMMVFVVGSLVMILFLGDLDSSIGVVASSLGNIGPGLGSLGPAGSFATIPDAGKVVLTFLMLLGRLEFFTILVILTPSFWRE
jgi:trk system potassium uptake protein TrkH